MEEEQSARPSRNHIEQQHRNPAAERPNHGPLGLNYFPEVFGCGHELPSLIVH
jgi:hypothetical protein